MTTEPLRAAPRGDGDPEHDTWREMLLLNEGLRLRPHLDTANPPRLTIGVGRNLDDRGITREEAMLLLDHDIARCLTELDDALPWWTELPTAARAVLVDLCFQMGIGKLVGFSYTLGALREGQYQTAAAHLLVSRYARQTPARAARNAYALRALS